jgi:hypothetical protein
MGGNSGRCRAHRLRHDQRVDLVVTAIDAEFVAVVGIVGQPRLLGKFRLLWQPGRSRQHQPVIGPERNHGQPVDEQW